jgi:hypothetical protein
MTKLEHVATHNLRDQSKRRHVAFKLAQCVDGRWRGVVFTLEPDDPRFARVTKDTRVEAVESLTRILRDKWPMRTGPKSKAKAA